MSYEDSGAYVAKSALGGAQLGIHRTQMTGQGGVYAKLIAARTELQNMEIKKSGHNKFAGYDYFELGDFLPAIQHLFAKYGLVDIIQFNKEMAVMYVVDTADGSSVMFTSPMADAQLKGCHPIQNLGAVETYQRRYLYVTAMAIVEHDALESVTGSANGAPAPKAAPAPRAEKVVSTDADQALFVDGLIELGRASTSLPDLSNLWKQNQAQIDGVKNGNPALFSKLQKQFAEIKSKLQLDKDAE